MSLLLHLSDLHLASDEDDEDLGHYKTDVVPRAARQRRVTTLRQTMRALATHLKQTRRTIDAIIVSGDVTYRGSRAGLEALPSLIQELGDCAPNRSDHIVVVPGNHDVHWETDPSTPERYEGFLEIIRSNGYTTPVLEGIDSLDLVGRDSPGPVIQINDEILIAAMNSANYSGVLEDVPNAVLAQVESLAAESQATRALATQLRRLRLHDIARINPDQLNAIVNAIDSGGFQPNAVRFAVMHHQLLPISSEEEVKTFEAFTNLGEIRAFLVANEFDVVLHGHKHTPRVYEDVLRDFDQPHADQPSASRRCVVASCGTIGMGQRGPGSEIGKLIDIRTGPGALRRAKIQSVPAVAGGGRLPSSSFEPADDFALRRTAPVGGPRVVSGRDGSSVHEQLVEIFDEKPDRIISGLICHIADSADAQAPPRTYPEVTAGEGLDAWFNDLVEWWQSDGFGEGKPFTHGQRLRHWSGHTDQLMDIVAELRAQNGTSRAVAVLVDPGTDHTLVSERRREFPAFCFAQFILVDGQLHATAIFRKQEMRYWWPINVAEISRLQADVARRLSADVPTRPGSITTYAVIAVAGATVPRVAVPKIDRASWEEPHLCWQLSAALFDPTAPGRAPLLRRLRDMLTEWRPTSDEPAPDGVPMPVHGLHALEQSLSALREVYPTSRQAERLVRLLTQIATLNERYRDRDVSDVRQYREWKNAIVPLIGEAEAVCVAANDPPTAD